MTAVAMPMAEVQALTDLTQINRLLQVRAAITQETISHERTIDAELEDMLAARGELERELVELHASSEVLELVKADAETMVSSIASTCELAQSVSQKVRELDLAQTRVRTTMTRVAAIVDRTHCVDGLQAALDGEDFEQAANYVQTFLSLDDDHLAPVAAPGEAPSAALLQAEEQRTALLAAKAQLEATVRERFAAASAKGDHKGAVRFAKLFTPLGLAEEGLQAFCGYVRGLIAARAKEDLRELDTSAQPDFVSALTNVLQDIGTAVETNGALLAASFPDDALLRACQELQRECDACGTAVLRKFVDRRSLDSLAGDIATANGGGGEKPDPLEVESYLEELLVLCQRSEEYNAFMLDKMRGGRGQLNPVVVNAFKTGSFNQTVQELTTYYIAMEEYYMVENVAKAIQIDEVTPDAPTASMADDVFYILQKCATRTLSIGSVQCVCAGLNHVNNLLGEQFSAALARRLRGGASKALSVIEKLAAVSSHPPLSRPPGLEFLVAVNTADVSAEYVVKLRRELEGYMGEMFQVTAERERIKTCLADLAETATAFRQMTQQGLEKLADALQPRLKARVEPFASASYELGEAEYAANEAEDVWVQGLVASAETTTTFLQTYLTGSNYDAWVQLLMDHVVVRVESVVMSKRFNQLGALQFERELRTLVACFAAATSHAVRDKFARLTQMATVLNLEAASEILDYWGDNAPGMTWRLTSAEVQRVLGLRVEFRQEQIAALQL